MASKPSRGAVADPRWRGDVRSLASGRALAPEPRLLDVPLLVFAALAGGVEIDDPQDAVTGRRMPGDALVRDLALDHASTAVDRDDVDVGFESFVRVERARPHPDDRLASDDRPRISAPWALPWSEAIDRVLAEEAADGFGIIGPPRGVVRRDPGEELFGGQTLNSWHQPERSAGRATRAARAPGRGDVLGCLDGRFQRARRAHHRRR